MLETGSGLNRFLHGVIRTHVDDGVCGSGQFFHDQLMHLRKSCPLAPLNNESLSSLGSTWSNFLKIAF